MFFINKTLNLGINLDIKMKRQIFIIRHAKSSWNHVGLKDFDRPLNDRGLKDAPIMAKVFKGLIKDQVKLISSPANRAITTAEVFAAALQQKPEDIRKEEILYYGDETDYLDCLTSVDNNDLSVALFGHNPKVEHFSARVSNPYLGEVPTCAIMAFEYDGLLWNELSWNKLIYLNHYFPKEL